MNRETRFGVLSALELLHLVGGDAQCMNNLQKQANGHVRNGNEDNGFWDKWADRFELCAMGGGGK